MCQVSIIYIDRDMWVLLISLLVLGLLAALLGWWRNRVLGRKLEQGEIEALPTVKQPDDSGCCGQHIVCEKQLCWPD